MAIQIHNIKDIHSFEVQEVLKDLTSSTSVLNLRLAIVSLLSTGEVVGVWNVYKISFPDELNSKQISIQGQEVSPLLSQFANFKSSTIESVQNSLRNTAIYPNQSVDYSANQFGVVMFYA